MTDDWKSTMDAATEMAATTNGLEFHELRNAWATKYCDEDNWPEGEGLGSSDMNHLLYSVVKHDTMELARLAAKLGADKAERNRIVQEVADAAGIHPDLALQQLREFFAPVAP